MYIYSLGVTFEPERTAEVERLAREDAYPTLNEFGGFRRLLVLVDETTGTGLALSFWDDEQARALASRAAAFHALYERIGRVITLAPVSGVYRVIFEQAA